MIEGVGCGQHGEDRILKLVFKGQDSGVVVDVGAADGYSNSNSAGLLQRGWSGILVEPELDQYRQLTTRYKGQERVTCVHCAVGLSEGMKTLWAGGQVSTFDPGVKQAAEDVHHTAYTKQQVEMRTLTRVLVQVDAPSNIDFLSIDVEGMNYEAWRSLDKARFSPKLVCIEGKGYAMDGYSELCRLGGNTFYLREDACHAL